MVCNKGVLSPKLFKFYMDLRLFVRLSEITVGGSIGGTMINHLLYADDIYLLSLSSQEMQAMLYISAKYAIDHDIVFNEATLCICVFLSKIVPLESVLKLILMVHQLISWKSKYFSAFIDSNHNDS